LFFDDRHGERRFGRHEPCEVVGELFKFFCPHEVVEKAPLFRFGGLHGSQWSRRVSTGSTYLASFLSLTATEFARITTPASCLGVQRRHGRDAPRCETNCAPPAECPAQRYQCCDCTPRGSSDRSATKIATIPLAHHVMYL
jgi:hypothetical protein